MQLIQIGNSKGIRIPKVIIEQAKLQNTDLTFKVLDDGLLIYPVKKKSRLGWQFSTKKALQQSKLAEVDNEWLDANLDDYE